jgi:glycosyltransferase involved in cell wall biosynthesis
MCKGGSFWQAFRARCYPGAAARATLVAEAYIHRWLGTYRKCVDLFLAPSRFVRDKFVEHGWDAALFKVLPHFQNIHAIGDPPNDGPILYFGRLSAEKGIEDLIPAMQRVPDIHLVVAGDGPQKNELERLTASLRLTNVEFVGHLGAEERDRGIAQSRFTVLPSHAYETLGKTILESSAYGRPVVASDLGSRRELIHDGETGLLYPVGSVNHLADAIRLLATNPELTKKMGRAGWEMARCEHTPEQHDQKLTSLYDRLVAGKPKRPRAALARADEAQPGKPRLRVAFIGGRGVISNGVLLRGGREAFGSDGA